MPRNRPFHEGRSTQLRAGLACNVSESGQSGFRWYTAKVPTTGLLLYPAVEEKAEVAGLLLGDRGRHDLVEPGIVAHAAEFFVFVDISHIAVTLFLGLLQALETVVHVSTFGVCLGQ